jgi:hypothetical protein
MGLVLYWTGFRWTKHMDNAKSFTLQEAQNFKDTCEYNCHVNTYEDNTNWKIK